jgi:uncharacterized repeat protein (TIGR03803 family)
LNFGTVFKLDANGNETVLHSFSGSDGKNPLATLVLDGTGNLYGTTLTGGTFDYGTVFKLNTTGKFQVLHSFAGADGRIPQAGLIFDAAGNLYGTTAWGGAYDHGTIFRLDRITGQETIVHSFNIADGAVPLAGLIRDAAGNFYGTTNSGGASDKGTVFRLDVTGNEVVLYSFKGVPDGQAPYGGLVLDSAGNLYGTTANGGDEGFGTVFKLDVTGTETILHTFRHRADGESPQAGLLRDAKGNLYGTTVVGGSGLDDGTVFELDANGNYKMLHIFTGADGDRPRAALIRGAVGDFYGTTSGGGLGYGIVFKLTR